jgi:hypothetical protein
MTCIWFLGAAGEEDVKIPISHRSQDAVGGSSPHRECSREAGTSREWGSIYSDLTDSRLSVATIDFGVVRNLLAFCQALNASSFKGRSMDEYVGTTVLGLDKPKTLLAIEEFHCALAHLSSFQTRQNDGMRRCSALPIFDRWKECLTRAWPYQAWRPECPAKGR